MPKKTDEKLTDGKEQSLALINIPEPLPSNSISSTTEETKIFALITQQFPVSTIDDGAKLVEIYGQVSGVREDNLDREHKRLLENRQQDLAEKELNQKNELEKSKQNKEVDEANQKIALEKSRIELEKTKESNREKDKDFQRELEQKEQDRLWQLTYLSFATGVCLMLIGISGGAIIAASSLTIPASSFLIKKIRDKKAGEA
jgi:hypothetical protein